MSRIISQFKECDAKAYKLIQDIDAISYQAVRQQAVVKLEALALELQTLTDQKIVLSNQMNKMITLNIVAFSKKFQSEDHTERLSSVAPSGSSTPRGSIEFKEKPVPTPTPKKKPSRGRPARKGLFESNQGVQEQPLALMMLAGAAENEAIKLTKLPITKRAEKPRKRRRAKQQMVKAKGENSDSDEEDQETDNNAKTTEADENEPVYCICGSISNGPMVECDNEACSLEWFHFNCVNLKKAPKGKW